MKKEEISEIECMLVVIFKRLEGIEKKLGNGFRSAPLSSYYTELKRDAQKVRESVEKKINSD
ncbi:MAG TPA: hypothetical protein VK498_08625 [Ferruginibacter sp.]|nr:hypothetical protein [Ferruginibacter sp.]